MRHRTVDVIGCVEAAYAAAATDREWLERIAGALMPVAGAASMVAFTAELAGLRIEAAAERGPQPAALADLVQIWREAPREAFEVAFSPRRPVGIATRRMRESGEAARTFSAVFARLGIEEGLGLVVAEPDGHALVAGVPYRHRRAFSPRLVQQLTRVCAHLHSGLRLRRRLAAGARAARGGPATTEQDGAVDAILSPAGVVAHAEGPALAGTARTQLTEAVRRVERARGFLRRASPDEALELWRGLVNGAWSIVDHEDSDGRRFLLARRNAPGVPDPKALTATERDVVAYAALGRSNKFIGYMLGLSPSTIAAHLRSAERKLGLSSRWELIRMFARFGRSDAETAKRRQPSGSSRSCRGFARP